MVNNILISTTGLTASVILYDLGERVINHPTTNLNIGLEFTYDELYNSADFLNALNLNWLTATYDGKKITSTSFKPATVDDISSGVLDSRGYLYFSSNVTNTTFSSRTVYYNVVGTCTTISSYNNNLTTVTSPNRMTFTLASATASTIGYLKYSATLSVSNASGDNLYIGLRKRDYSTNVQSIITPVTFTPASNTSQPITITGIVSAKYLDYFEVVVRNDSYVSGDGGGGNTTILVEDFVFTMFT